MPLFIVYVLVVSKWLWPGVFLISHAALVVLYASCLAFLARRIVGLSPVEPAYALFFVALTPLHSDALVGPLSSLDRREARFSSMR